MAEPTEHNAHNIDDGKALFPGFCTTINTGVAIVAGGNLSALARFNSRPSFKSDTQYTVHPVNTKRSP